MPSGDPDIARAPHHATGFILDLLIGIIRSPVSLPMSSVWILKAWVYARAEPQLVKQVQQPGSPIPSARKFYLTFAHYPGYQNYFTHLAGRDTSWHAEVVLIAHPAYCLTLNVPVGIQLLSREVFPVGEPQYLVTEGSFECDLRLMELTSERGIPEAGEDLIIVANVDATLHFRIFDREGTVVKNTDERTLTAQTEPTVNVGQQIADLKNQLSVLWPPHKLTQEEKDKIKTAVASILNYTPPFQATPDGLQVRLNEAGWMHAFGDSAEHDSVVSAIRTLEVPSPAPDCAPEQ